MHSATASVVTMVLLILLVCESAHGFHNVLGYTNLACALVIWRSLKRYNQTVSSPDSSIVCTGGSGTANMGLLTVNAATVAVNRNL